MQQQNESKDKEKKEKDKGNHLIEQSIQPLFL